MSLFTAIDPSFSAISFMDYDHTSAIKAYMYANAIESVYVVKCTGQLFPIQVDETEKNKPVALNL